MSLNKKYIRLYFTVDTIQNLIQYCLSNEIDIHTNYNGEKLQHIRRDFHITIMYSNNTPNKPIKMGDVKLPRFRVWPGGFDLFGENKNCLVLKIGLDKILANIRSQFNEYGLMDNHDKFSPHVTLSYNSKELKTLPKINFPLYVEKLVISDQ